MGHTKKVERASPRRSGFTLVELLFTLTIGSVLMAIAIPSFNELIASNQLSAQSNSFIAAMNLARSEAIKRNSSVTFCRATSTTATTCATAAGQWQNWIMRTGTGTVIRRDSVRTFSGRMVVQSSLTSDQVVFGADGLATTGGVAVADHYLDICSKRLSSNNARRVVMSAGSRMSTTTLGETCP